MITDANWAHSTSYLLPLLVFVIVIRRSLRERKVKTNRMWIYPAVLAAAAITTMVHEPIPGLVAIAGFVGAALVGAGLGYLRARHQQFSLDPATGEVSTKATPIGMILVGGFFVLRFGLEFYTHARDVPHALGLQRATDAGLIFAFALMSAQRWEIWKRAQATRAANVPNPEPPANG